VVNSINKSINKTPLNSGVLFLCSTDEYRGDAYQAVSWILRTVLPMERASLFWTTSACSGLTLMLNILADIVGMAGTSLVVGAFFLLQLNKLSPKGLIYNLMNLSGALFLLFSLCINFNLASFVIEIFWIAASLIGLYGYRKQQRKQQTAT
jgi:predicted membrane protein